MVKKRVKNLFGLGLLASWPLGLLAVTWLIVGFGYFGKHVAREDHANIH
jgi:hypothetical protein